jgi:hypothetical protein
MATMTADDRQEEKLSSKQEMFIEALLAGHTILDAAKMVQIGERTAHRWLHNPSVDKAYRDAQRRIFDESLNYLQTDISDARQVLVDIMKDPLVAPGVRVRSAQIILEMSLETHRIAELEQRIEELEGRRL